jgi:hypothetical protein
MSVDNATGVTFASQYTVTYVNLYITIFLYVLDIDEQAPVGEGEDDYDIYTMDLMYCQGTNYYIPLSNFAKFTSNSIASIDGGVIEQINS